MLYRKPPLSYRILHFMYPPWNTSIAHGVNTIYRLKYILFLRNILYNWHLNAWIFVSTLTRNCIISGGFHRYKTFVYIVYIEEDLRTWVSVRQILPHSGALLCVCYILMTKKFATRVAYRLWCHCSYRVIIETAHKFHGRLCSHLLGLTWTLNAGRYILCEAYSVMLTWENRLMVFEGRALKAIIGAKWGKPTGGLKQDV